MSSQGEQMSGGSLQQTIEVTLTRGQVNTLVQLIRSYELRGTKDQVQAIARVFTEVEVVLTKALNPPKSNSVAEAAVEAAAASAPAHRQQAETLPQEDGA